LGAKVTAHYNSNTSTLQPLLEQYSSTHLHLAQANLASEESVSSLFKSLTFGAVQVVVINHGIWPNVEIPLQEMSLDHWNNTMNVNLTSSFLVSREYLKGLKDGGLSEEEKRKAAIVFIGSTSGRFGEKNHADYACSKSGEVFVFCLWTHTDDVPLFVAMMYGLTLSLKNEIVKLAPYGRVNCVAPGWVNTPMSWESMKHPEVINMALAT
jgi:NAD(P)-dependent dehydrogenase (short-subunit alcohol dehydrogenase family)